MTVSTIASIAAGITRATGGNSNAKASTVLDSLVSNVGRTTTNPSADSADLGTALKLQNQVAQFRVASQNVAQANAVLSVAAGGATEITQTLTKLKDLAAQASDPALTDEQRATLNSEFQAARSDITRITDGTAFNGEKLLTGTSEQLKTSGDAAGKSLSVGSFVQDVLFPSSGPDPLDISTVASAKDAFPAAFAALNYAAQQTGNIFALQDGLDYASTTLESAIQNQDAARSTLSESDFNVQADATASTNTIDSLLAQTNRLPNNILQLLAE